MAMSLTLGSSSKTNLASYLTSGDHLSLGYSYLQQDLSNPSLRKNQASLPHRSPIRAAGLPDDHLGESMAQLNPFALHSRAPPVVRRFGHTTGEYGLARALDATGFLSFRPSPPHAPSPPSSMHSNTLIKTKSRRSLQPRG